MSTRLGSAFRARGKLRLVVVAVVCTCLGLGFFVFWHKRVAAPLNRDGPTSSVPVEDPRLTYSGPYRNVRPEVRYVGDETCRRCHAEIAGSYHKHPMGHSMEPVAPGMPAGSPESTIIATFEASGLHYTVERHGQRIFHRETCRDAQGAVVVEREAEVHFLLGSGTHGFSFLVGEDGYLF
jgi:hypothetical protein